MDPQDCMMVSDENPMQGLIDKNSLVPFLRLTKDTLQVVFEFMSPLELVRLTAVCRRLCDKFPLQKRPPPNYEYLWRLHCSRELTFCQKYFADTWRTAFIRCR